MAAAVSCGKTTPGSRKTTTWEKDLLGRVYRNDVGEGVDAGSVIMGQPVGMMPKAGVDILEVVDSSKTGKLKRAETMLCQIITCGAHG